MSKELRHDMHAVSLLSDHMAICPKYTGKVLVDEVAMVAKGVIKQTRKELGIEVIDMAMILCTFLSSIHQSSVNFIVKRIKGRSSRALRQAFPKLKEWCKNSLWPPSCYHGNVGYGWEIAEKYIDGQEIVVLMYNKQVLDLNLGYSSFNMSLIVKSLFYI